jgi:membrane-bound metal-dependent hydrolase YbcI (DUF457 family)
MTGKGHWWIGAIVSPISFELAHSAGGIGWLALLMTFSGATAPDWLEIRKPSGGTVITHRTITHWLPLWCLALVAVLATMDTPIAQGLNKLDPSMYQLIGELLSPVVASALIGFLVGGLSHLATDFPNPMGIPIVTPWHRLSLNLWNSGEGEKITKGLAVAFVLFYFDIHLWVPWGELRGVFDRLTA